MQRFKLVIIVSCLILPNLLSAQDKSLTELQKLKAENFQLKIQIAQLKATIQDKENKIASYELTAEQLKLIEEFRKQLDANEKDTFDWSCLCFKPVNK